MIERIDAAIKALPAKPSADLRYQRLHISEAIDLVRRMNHPKFKPASQKLINKELDELARLATALSQHIENMHSNALFGVERQPLLSVRPHSMICSDQLQVLSSV
jgi:type III secretory pathway lipoprotein EscJ